LVGETLRKKREELGKDLRGVADTLKIRHDYLKAIEEGDISRLPAPVYTRGYVSEYAKTLQLDPAEVLKAFLQETTPPSNSSEIDVETRARKNTTGRKTLLALPVAAVLLALFILVKGQLATDEETNVPSPAGIVHYDPAVILPAPEPVPSPLQAPQAASPAPSPPARAPAAVAADDDLVLQAFATEITWLRLVIDETDTREITMRPGEVVKWQAKKCFALKVGNAAGVRLLFNGEEVAAFGEKGEVKTITFPLSPARNPAASSDTLARRT
jgi:cytoskeleton protein RodZ